MSTARSLGLALALAAATIHLPNCEAKAGTIKLPWTTDETLIATFPKVLDGTKGVYGPDGPWQAVGLLTKDSGTEKGVLVPVWPTNSEVTELVSTRIGGGYAPNKTARNIWLEQDGVSGQMEMKNFDSWYSAYFGRYDNWGIGFYDNFTLMNFQNSDHSVNASVLEATLWNVRMQNGANYTATVGNLGLSPLNPALQQQAPDLAKALVQKGIVEQLVEDGTVASNFWSLHMGSVLTRQPGSLVLGGYEQNRALGPVGVFNHDGVLGLFLVDLVLGVDEGLSPFNVSASELGSVWPGVQSEVGKELAKMYGAKAGTAVVVPNPGSPGIYLPPGTCEAATSYLPVTWDKKTGYYLWNTTDPNYARIVNSPAYLGFVFADRTAANITVKVPFKLLNLTLESPIVEIPTPYFPCTSLESEAGVWALGRAFLQAAFLGVSYDQKFMFLAQAPGPDMDQSVIKTVSRNDTTLASNPIDSFATSWRSQWTVIKADDAGTSNTKSESTPVVDSETTGLTAAAKAGIAVGVILAVAVAATAFFLLWRRRKAYANVTDETATPSSAFPPDKTEPTTELGNNLGVYEMGRPLAHEVEAMEKVQEVPCYSMAVELPAVVPSPPYRSPEEAPPGGDPFELTSSSEAGQGGGNWVGDNGGQGQGVRRE